MKLRTYLDWICFVKIGCTMQNEFEDAMREFQKTERLHERFWRRRRIGGWEGWAVHWEFLPADQNAEAGIPIALLFTFTCAAPLNHFCLCFHFLTNCGAFFFLLKLILYFSILTFLHFLFFQWLFYLFFLITSFDLCSLRT